jgi:hypothetical protein
MATASKRLSRKALRQPDWFQITVEKLVELYETKRALVWLGVALVIAVLSGIWGWQLFKERQDDQAGQEFTRAMNLYRSEKYRDAVPAFQKVETYRWSRFSTLAHLYEANSYLASNELDKAITAAQRFIAATSPDSLYRQIGLLTLATAEVGKNQCQQAIEHYSEAERITGAFRDRAVIGKARCLEQIGDTKAAIVAYKEYLNDYPDSLIAVRIAELEAKTSGQATAK